MKNYGKYERKPVAVAPKQPKVKNVLLQTYFTSLLCLVLCVTMFLGTSYAWFTSEVTNTANEIYVGILKVGLYKENGSNLATSDSNSAKLFDGNIRWEPGYTTLETIKIVNEGDLAFKYVMSFTSDTDISQYARYFDVCVFNHYNKTYTAPTSYEEIVNSTDWENVGTLADVLAGKSVLSGVMETVRKENQEESEINEGTTDGVATTDTYTIALHMSEAAPTDLMGKKLTINAKLIAYQKAEEADGLGTTTYDQMVANEAELRNALATGGTVALAADIKLTDSVSVPSGVSTILDLNGHTISQTNECTGTYSMIANKGTLTINDSVGGGKISFTDSGEGDPNVGWASYTIHNSGNLTIENGTIEHLGTQTYNGNNAVFHYSGNTTINGGVISAPYSRSLRIWSGSATINGGTFDGQVWVQPNTDNCSLTINGGSFKPATCGNDASSVFITNETYNPSVSISGGNFATKIGCSVPSKLAGCITGGTFTDTAKQNTEATLFADPESADS